MGDNIDTNKLIEEFVTEIRDKHGHALHSGTGTIGPFIAEVEKLYRALDANVASITDLETRIEELGDESDRVRSAVGELLKDSASNESRRKALVTEMQKMQAQRGDIATSLSKASVRKAELNDSIAQVKDRLAVGVGWSEEQLTKRRQLITETDSMNRKIDQRTTELNVIRRDLENISVLYKQASEEHSNIKTNAELTKKARDRKKKEKEMATLAKSKKEQEIRQLKQEEIELRQLQSEREVALADEGKEIETIKKICDEMRQELEDSMESYENLHGQTIQSMRMLDKQREQNKQSEKDNARLKTTVQEKEKQLAEIRADIQKTQDLKATALRRLEAVDTERIKHEAEATALRNRLDRLNNELIMAARRESEGVKRDLERVTREKEILERKMFQVNQRTADVRDIIATVKSTSFTRKQEIKRFESASKDKQANIEGLAKAVKRNETDVKKGVEMYQNAAHDLRKHMITIQSLNRTLVESEQKLKQQQNLYEVVRNDRNNYSKVLIEAQDEITGLRRVFNRLKQMIDKLKDDILFKDHQLVREHFGHHKVEKECDQLRAELTTILKQQQSSGTISENQQFEVRQLGEIIAQAREERDLQEKELGAMESERDILISQLQKRNSELSAVFDKVRLQRASLVRGYRLYQERLEDGKRAGLRLIDLVKDLSSVKDGIKHKSDQTNQIVSLEKQVRQEQLKIASVRDELARPLRIHRWNLLQIVDPDRYLLITKVHRMQQQLVSTEAKVQARDRAIRERERLYVELRNVLNRRPGNEVPEQIATFQQRAKDKEKALRAMEEELEMYRQQVSTFTEEVQGLQRDRLDLEHQWVKTNTYGASALGGSRTGGSGGIGSMGGLGTGGGGFGGGLGSFPNTAGSGLAGQIVDEFGGTLDTRGSSADQRQGGGGGGAGSADAPPPAGPKAINYMEYQPPTPVYLGPPPMSSPNSPVGPQSSTESSGHGGGSKGVGFQESKQRGGGGGGGNKGDGLKSMLEPSTAPTGTLSLAQAGTGSIGRMQLGSRDDATREGIGGAGRGGLGGSEFTPPLGLGRAGEDG